VEALLGKPTLFTSLSLNHTNKEIQLKQKKTKKTAQKKNENILV